MISKDEYLVGDLVTLIAPDTYVPRYDIGMIIKKIFRKESVYVLMSSHGLLVVFQYEISHI